MPRREIVLMMQSFFQHCGISGRRFIAIAVAANVLLAAAASAEEANDFVDRLPRGYIGEFRWDGDKTVQNVAIRFDLVRPLDGQSAEAVGCGVYDTAGQITRIRVRMLVRWSDLQVEIFERSPEGNASFQIDGSHRGHLSKDLQQIDAEWTTRGTSQHGQLHLQASSSVVCAPASSV